MIALISGGGSALLPAPPPTPTAPATMPAPFRARRQHGGRKMTGMVMVNLPTAGVDYHVPFGGRAASSLGECEQGRMAMDFHTSVNTACTFAG